MKAIVRHSYGTADILELAEIERPTAKDDEVLIQVRATAITPFDWHMLTGTPYIARMFSGLLRPKHQVLGINVAGQVEAAGANVQRLQPGDEVFGHSVNHGGFAEYVCVPEAELMLKPASMSFEEAAAVPFGAVAALVCLCDLGKIEPGQKVLINGASGGVGTLAVQIAKSLGAEVTDVCSTRNLELVGSLGADQVIDYTQEDFAQKGARYNLIFDAVAKRSFSECKRALSPQGIYITTEFSPTLVLKGLWTSMTGDQKLAPMPPKPPNREIQSLYKEMVQGGKLRPVIDRHYPLSEVPEAFRYYAKGHARGRVVINM